MQAQIQPLLKACANRVTVEPYTARPEDCLQATDVLVLPSHREGFGVVIIEAAAMQVPAIASRIYGISDALVEGQTGLMFEVRQSTDLLAQMRQLALNPELRQRLGRQARERVQQDFDQTIVVGAFVNYYASVLP
jgi:glycosyltransferase involved in cell wall biosynthesis